MSDKVPWLKTIEKDLLRRENGPFFSLQREMNRLFDDFFHDFSPGFMLEKKSGTFLPKLSIAEKEKEISLSLEIPGMDEKDISITLAAGSIIIEGEKKSETEETKDSWHVTERSYGHFRREIPLPPGIDRDKISAEASKGVLQITIPRSAEGQRDFKKIEIKSR